MPIEIKQLSVKSNVVTPKESDAAASKKSCGNDSSKQITGGADSARTAPQFQLLKWTHRKLQQEARER
jgi:hypothetical protein